MLRKVVLGSIGVGLVIPSVSAASPAGGESAGPARPPPMRPSDLPIYESPHADYGEYMREQEKSKRKSIVREALSSPVRAVREQVQSVMEHTESVQNMVQDNYHQLQDNSQWIVNYLREEDNKEIRYGAVAMGGLTGFIFGLRGGFIRRVFYAGLGTTGMGLICFPEDTKEILKNNSTLARQYVNIAYNFLYGVKPGDPQLEVKFPELSLPKSMSELMDMTVSLASSVKQAVMPPPSKETADNKPKELKE